MYERPESPYCPVKCFELYLSKLNPTLSCLWQRPQATEHFSRSDEVWYCNLSLSKNTLGTFMSSISKELKLSQKYTNHCIRATAVSLLDESNFEARHIMRVSGHKSESSIRSYSRRLSEVKHKEISHALRRDCSVKNLESTSTAIVAMHEQTSENYLGKNPVPNSTVTMQNFASGLSQSFVFSHSNITVTLVLVLRCSIENRSTREKQNVNHKFLSAFLHQKNSR